MIELDKVNWKETEDGRWLAYQEDGTQITGWLHDLQRDTWFWCYSDDVAKGWFKDSDGRWYYFFPEQCVDYNRQMYKGEMKTGWLQDKGKWYYLSPFGSPIQGIYRGMMLQSITETIDNVDYTFGVDGSWIEPNNGISNKCAEFIGSWEGFYSKAYADPYYGTNVKAYWTIGYGTCYCVKPEAFSNGLNSTCTKEQALEWLKEEANKCYFKIKKVAKDKGLELNEDQLSALTSFSYNCGTSALFGSTLWRNICNGVRDENTIKNNFCAWSMANGQRSEGLYRRRVREANMFLYGTYENN